MVIEGGLSCELVDKVLNIFNNSHFSKFVGVEIVALGNGLCRITCPVKGDLLNSYNGVHGGVMATLADVSMGLAVATHGRKTVTAELNVNYLAQAVEGEVLVAEGRVVHQGDTLLVAECSISNSSDRLIAIARGMYVGKNPPLADKNNL